MQQAIPPLEGPSAMFFLGRVKFMFVPGTHKSEKVTLKT